MSPKYVAEADLSDLVDPKRPVLKLCTMTPEGNLQIPESERKKWLNDPVRSGLSWCKFLMFEKFVFYRISSNSTNYLANPASPVSATFCSTLRVNATGSMGMR